jgi:lysophospholipase L1-like esterase
MKKHTLSKYAVLLCLFFGLIILISPALLADPLSSSIRVACVGDSITYGTGLKDRMNESYPAWLGLWLGTNYDVRNFGHSGATLLKKGDLPYVQQREHADAIAFKPDVVIIMLGTNDSKHHGGGLPTTNNVAQNWNWQNAANFAPDYKALIAEFRKANPAVKIWICCPTPCFPGRWGIDDNTIHNEIVPLVQQVAAESQVNVINLYNAFAGQKDMFPDTVHPNAAGAKRMAAIIYTNVFGKLPPATST